MFSKGKPRNGNTLTGCFAKKGFQKGFRWRKGGGKKNVFEKLWSLYQPPSSDKSATTLP